MKADYYCKHPNKNVGFDVNYYCKYVTNLV
jgi:hypothetical protein